jgi:hypothetical protein
LGLAVIIGSVIGVAPVASAAVPTKTTCSKAAKKANHGKCPKSTATTVSPLTTTTTLGQSTTGTGNAVVTVTFPTTTAAIAHLTNHGRGTFSVSSSYPDGQSDQIVNTTGNYDGTRLINAIVSKEVKQLVITDIGGSWSVDIQPLTKAPVVPVPGPARGTGDSVVIVRGQASQVQFQSSPHGAFKVWAYTASLKSLIVDTVAPYTARVAMPPGTALLEITATGPWAASFIK